MAGVYKVTVRDTATYEGQADTHLEYEEETFTITVTDGGGRSSRSAAYGGRSSYGDYTLWLALKMAERIPTMIRQIVVDGYGSGSYGS